MKQFRYYDHPLFANFLLFLLIFQALKVFLYVFPFVVNWDARTRLPGRRTRVRRSGTRRRGRDAADRASVPRRATWRVPNRADAAKIGADAAEISVSADIGRYRPESAETARFGPKFKKKKKKRCKTHHLT